MSKRRMYGWASAVLTILFTAVMATAQTTVYNAVPSPLAPNYASQPFQAQQASEFGDYVHLAGSDRLARSVTFTMSNWALQSDSGSVNYCNANPTLCNAQGYYYPFTLNFYTLGGTLAGGLRDHGPKIGTVTQTLFVPWRPVADPTCANPSAWRAGDGNCYNGYAYNMTFDLSNNYIVLPNDVIVGIVYNTQSYGPNPTGVDGPYNSLNVAVGRNATVPTVGADDSNDRTFFKTITAAWYGDGGAAGTGNFREDNGWNIPAQDINGTVLIKIDAAPLPTAQNLTASIGDPLQNPGTWLFYNDQTDVVNNSLGSLVNGPATPPIGTGSARIQVSGSTGKVNLATYQFSGIPLSSIGILKYSTYNASATNLTSDPTAAGYLGFNVDFNESDTFQNRLNCIPRDNGTVLQDTWQEWDCINNGNAVWSYSRNSTWPIGIGGGGEPSGTAPGAVTKTWSQILSQYPNARIKVTDSHLGIRVGEPYTNGFVGNIDAFKFGTTNFYKIWNFDPQPAVVYVDDNWVGTTPGTDPDGAGPATSFGFDSFATIQGGIDGVAAGGTVNVAAGNYNEDLALNKDGVILSGAGATGTNIIGPIGGSNTTIFVTGNNNEIRGFTITRAGNNTTDWYGSLNTAGVAIQGLAITGANIHDNNFYGNRTAIDINNSGGHSIHNNVMDTNRTGLVLRNTTNNLNVYQNQITNNWTVGIVFLDGSSGSNTPAQTCTGCTFFNNNISGNWYGNVVDRQTGGSLPAPGGSPKNFSGNYLGSSAPSRTTSDSGEPGYGTVADGPGNIPPVFGGTAPHPSGKPEIAGSASLNFDYSPYLVFGGDTQPGVYGFQGNFSSVNVTSDGSQIGGGSRIQEANDLMSAGGTLTVPNTPSANYPGNVSITKAINVKGSFSTVGGSFALAAAGSQISPGYSPGIINTGNFSMVAGSTFNAEVNGNIAGAQYDQVNVTGSVNLGNANLNMTLGYAPATGHSYTIINNDGADAVVGTFNSLPEGTVFSIGANTFKISYVGGTGNDVVITAVSLCNAVSIPTNYTVQNGQNVSVAVNVDDMTGHGLQSTDFDLSYDPSVINAPVVSLGSTTGSSTLTVNNSTPGVLRISVFKATPWSGAGSLVNIQFTAVGQPGTSSAVSFTAFKFNEGTPCVTTSNGLVSVISGTMTGTVSYRVGSRPVGNATITGVGSVNVSTTTIAPPGPGTGTYSLSGFGAGAYTVTPSKSGDDHNAVTGFDAGLIAQYVVGLIGLTSDQQTVADVSGAGGITSFDAALIARYAALLPNAGSSGTWRFIPTSRNYANVNANISGQDYTAFLMGDVSGNWDTVGTSGLSPIRDRATKPVSVSMPATKAARGSQIDIPVTISGVEGKGVISYDLDVTYDPSVLEPVAEGVETKETLSSSRFITTNPTEPGHLRVVTFGAMPFEAGNALVTLRFNVIGDVDSSTPLEFGMFRFNEGGISTKLGAGSLTVTAPEAGQTSVNGRVVTNQGTAISGARVTFTDTAGNSRTVIANTFGQFQLTDAPFGATYTVTVSAKRYTFKPMTVSVSSNLTGIDLIADQ